MRAITAVMAAISLLGVITAGAPARADEDEHGGWRRHEHRWRGEDEDRWREHRWGEHRWLGYGQPPVAYAPPGYYAVPRYYAAPPPAYYAAPPAYYLPPPPPPVYSAPGFSIGFGFR